MVAQRSVNMSSMAPNLVADRKHHTESQDHVIQKRPDPGQQEDLIRTLIEGPSSVAVEGVEQSAEQVAEDRRPRAAGHQVERQQGQHHTGVTCRDTTRVHIGPESDRK